MLKRVNRHPVDALADVRDEIRKLKQREEELRNDLLFAKPADRIGVECEASIEHQEFKRLNSKAIIEHFGEKALAPFRKSYEYDAIYLKRRQEKRP